VVNLYGLNRSRLGVVLFVTFVTNARVSVGDCAPPGDDTSRTAPSDSKAVRTSEDLKTTPSRGGRYYYDRPARKLTLVR
jgi:hypothetical protein